MSIPGNEIQMKTYSKKIKISKSKILLFKTLFFVVPTTLIIILYNNYHFKVIAKYV